MLERYGFYESDRFKMYFDRKDYRDLSFSKYRKVYESNGRVIKIGRAGELNREAAGLKVLGKLGLAPKFIDKFEWNGFQVIVMEKVSGENLIHEAYLKEPLKFVEEYARCLYRLHHEVEIGEEELEEIIVSYPDTNLKKINEIYKNDMICDVMLRRNYNMSIDEGMRYLRENYSKLKKETIIHGDVCLPNILFKKGKFSKFIDLDGFGFYDYHYDVFWALWTLVFNLGSNRYSKVFLEAYGEEKIDEERLKLCGIISCLLSEKNMEELE